MKEVTITYCVPCGYLKRAMQTAELLKEEIDLEATLIPGTGGVFRVETGGEVIAQRTREHFPTTEEILELVRSHR